jgi:hypothetical protein
LLLSTAIAPLRVTAADAGAPPDDQETATGLTRFRRRVSDNGAAPAADPGQGCR